MPYCRSCSQSFEVDQKDLEFYRTISPVFAGQVFQVPAPTLCPTCRVQRRYVWRGELHLFRRTCAYSGKNIITFYPPEAPVQVYDYDTWWSDAFEPLAYGKDFDFSQPFFPQFAKLISSVPLLSRSSTSNENSDFTNCTSWNKNCYLLGGANHNEDCLYGNYVNRSKNSVDNNFIDSCELCYECVDCINCYDLKYSQNCSSCTESYFLMSCRNCSQCFGCVNLVGKQNHFFNQALSPEAYRQKIAEMRIDRRSSLDYCAQEFEQHRLQFPYKYRIGELNENVTGNSLKGCKDSFDCFDASGLWDCRYCHWLHNAKSCMDMISWGFPVELCYECAEAGAGAYHALFSVSSYSSEHVLYCYYAMSSKNCFGCVGVKKREYCILNKQYTKEQYEELVPKIIMHMHKHGEWGEFFPIQLSPLSYNTSIAQDYFPLDQAAAQALGMRWHLEEARAPTTVIDMPETISEVDDSFVAQVFTCLKSGKPFRITKQELQFYRRNNVPLPQLCFEERHKRRLAKRNPRFLWDRSCADCGTALRSSFNPERPEKVVCEDCYLKAVY